MGVHEQLQAPADLLPGKNPDTSCTESWVVATACLNVQPVPSCYTVCAVQSTVSTAYFVNVGHYAIQ